MHIKKLLIVVLTLLVAGLLAAQDAKVDFSGTWTMNADKSEFGGGGGGRGGRGGRMGGGSRMVVAQKDNLLTLERFRMNRDGEEMSTVYKYTLDGKECDNSSDWRSEVATASWSKDGKKLTIISTMTMSRGDREFSMDSESVWSMKGDNLVIESIRSTPRGEMESKMVYDREKE
jgi:hypothetical protein